MIINLYVRMYVCDAIPLTGNLNRKREFVGSKIITYKLHISSEFIFCLFFFSHLSHAKTCYKLMKIEMEVVEETVVEKTIIAANDSVDEKATTVLADKEEYAYLKNAGFSSEGLLVF